MFQRRLRTLVPRASWGRNWLFALAPRERASSHWHTNPSREGHPAVGIPTIGHCQAAPFPTISGRPIESGQRQAGVRQAMRRSRSSPLEMPGGAPKLPRSRTALTGPSDLGWFTRQATETGPWAALKLRRPGSRRSQPAMLARHLQNRVSKSRDRVPRTGRNHAQSTPGCRHEGR